MIKIIEGVAEIPDVDSFVTTLDSISNEYGCVIQAFNATYIAGESHLRTAVTRAKRANRRDDMITDSLRIEVLCYAAGRRQINQALEIGVKQGSDQPIVLVAFNGYLCEASAILSTLIEEQPVIGTAREASAIKQYFGITDREIKASSATLEELVIERVSLLAVEK